MFKFKIFEIQIEIKIQIFLTWEKMRLQSKS